MVRGQVVVGICVEQETAYAAGGESGMKIFQLARNYEHMTEADRRRKLGVTAGTRNSGAAAGSGWKPGEPSAGSHRRTSVDGSLRVLRLTSMSQYKNCSFILRWRSTSNCMYSVSATTNLLVPFIPIASNIPATPPENVFTTGTEDIRARFYRIEIQRPK